MGTPLFCRQEPREATAVSMCSHLGHTNVSSSQPECSASIPNSCVAVPQSEQFGRVMESKRRTVDWLGIIGIGPLLVILTRIRLTTCLVPFEIDHHRFRMFALRTFKRALIVVRRVGWLDASKPHSRIAFRARRQINWLRRIVEMRLFHDSHSRYVTQAGVRLVSQPPTPRTEPRSMMFERCARPMRKSIRERPDPR